MEHRMDEIICNSLKVVNSDGQVVASVGADEQGHGKVVVFDNRGEPRVEVDGNGRICIYGEHGFARAFVGINQQGDGAVSVIGRNAECGRATPRSADADVDQESTREEGNDESAILPRLGAELVRGYEGSVRYKKPILVRFGNHQCESEDESWRNLIARVCELIGVENPNQYTDWNANRIREEIVNLINRHLGIRPHDIWFEVYDRRE